MFGLTMFRLYMIRLRLRLRITTSDVSLFYREAYLEVAFRGGLVESSSLFRRNHFKH